MIRTALRLSPAFIPLVKRRYEHDYDHINTVQTEKPVNGFDRVKLMYSADEFGAYSVELQTVVQSSMCGAFFGAVLGGFVKSREAYLYFIENNQATIFKSTVEAKKKLQDYVTVAFAKGAVHYGWRLGIFTGMFSCIATTISVYRGDTSLAEYIAAGTIAGGLYKCNLGLAATIVGAGLGAVLSTIGGMLIIGILKVTGFTMDDVRNALHKITEARKDQMHQAEEKASEIKNDALTKHHDSLIEQRGAKKVKEVV